MLSHSPIPNSSFGVRADPGPGAIIEKVARLINDADQLRSAFYSHGGLMVIPSLHGIPDHPELLVSISELFGPEVENVRGTLTTSNFFHPAVDEIMVLSNQPPCSHPPPRRVPSELSGELITTYPERPNWHTDQSYRRPPPDVSLLYALTVPPAGQGQTLYADCAAAWERLGEQQREEIRGLVGIHSPTLIGRSADAVRAGEAPASLLPHQRPQQQPLVRVHPVTGRESLYLCEPEQLDFVDGPIVGMETGPDGAGARLIDDLLAHVTRAKFVYAHTWQPGDLVIGDNRCLLHCASWYDANHYARMMWRTTVYGNPGEHYAGELPSWIPEDGTTPMAGLEHAKHC